MGKILAVKHEDINSDLITIVANQTHLQGLHCSWGKCTQEDPSDLLVSKHRQQMGSGEEFRTRSCCLLEVVETRDNHIKQLSQTQNDKYIFL